MSLEEMVPKHNRVDFDNVRCPACQSGEHKIINRGLAHCQNDNCLVCNFEPQKKDMTEEEDD